MAPLNAKRYCFPLARLLVLLWLSCGGCYAVHFESGFTDKIVIDAQQKVVQMRTKRETPVKHKTQHLKPAIEIEPINEKVRVAMPHFNVQELTTYANQADAAIATRFDEFEPTLLASNGKRASSRRSFFLSPSVTIPSDTSSTVTRESFETGESWSVCPNQPPE